MDMDNIHGYPRIIRKYGHGYGCEILYSPTSLEKSKTTTTKLTFLDASSSQSKSLHELMHTVYIVAHIVNTGVDVALTTERPAASACRALLRPIKTCLGVVPSAQRL